MSAAEVVSMARAAHDGLVQGRLTDVGRSLLALESIEDATAGAWARAIRAELALVSPRHGRLLQESDFDELESCSPSAQIALARGALSTVMANVLAFDASGVTRIARRAREMPHPDSESALHVQLATTWSELLRGDDAAASRSAQAIAKSAQQGGFARLVVDAHALRALAAISEEPRAALELARRASLIARTEALPQPEFLAHLVLCRARRFARQPHLAARVSATLFELAPAPWHPWIAWEHAFASGSPGEKTTPALCALSEMLSAAGAGNRAAYRAHAAALEHAVEGFAPARRDALALLAVMDAARPAPDADVASWRSGQSVLLPPSIAGFRPPGGDDESAWGYVLAYPGSAGVRIIHAANSLVDAPDLVRIAQSGRPQGRVETLISVLALAGPDGVEEAECFERVYEFAFMHARHRGTFDVLVHRARACLERGRIERTQRGSLRLVLDAPLLVPDARASERTSDRVLSLLAKRGSMSAKEAANTLGISIRTAQGALIQLSESGACDPRKEGKNVKYVVEDSVFSEPTQKLVPEGLSGLTRL